MSPQEQLHHQQLVWSHLLNNNNNNNWWKGTTSFTIPYKRILERTVVVTAYFPCRTFGFRLPSTEWQLEMNGQLAPYCGSCKLRVISGRFSETANNSACLEKPPRQENKPKDMLLYNYAAAGIQLAARNGPGNF